MDKDIKSNNQNKCYCLEQCQFVDFGENTRQANKTRDMTSKLVDRFDLKGNYIDTGYRFEYLQMGFYSSGIGDCCGWYACENLDEWYKTHNYKPVKSVKGFIFKYHDE